MSAAAAAPCARYSSISLLRSVLAIGFSRSSLPISVSPVDEIYAAASAEHDLDVNVLFGLVERGKQRGVRVRFWNTTSKYSTESPEALCPWSFERPYISSDQRVVPCYFIGNPDVAEIDTAPAKPANFASVWFGPNFRAFRSCVAETNAAKALATFVEKVMSTMTMQARDRTMRLVHWLRGPGGLLKQLLFSCNDAAG
jgi:hypothetical protein